MRRAAAFVAVAAVVSFGGLGAGACASPQLDRAGARTFTAGALRTSGVDGVRVLESTDDCEVEGAKGWRTFAETAVGEVSLCVSRDQGRALSVRDPGLSEAQFARLEAHRGETAADRARPLAAGSAALLLAGVSLRLALLLRPPGPAS